MIGEPRPGARILVVEDEPEFAGLVGMWLERHGWRAEIVHDGANAVVAFGRDQPDLVLLDLSLPSLDGWAVIEQLRSVSPVPILIVTARDAEQDKIRGLGAGADDYVTKPFSFPELMARVAAVLRRSAGAHAADDGTELRVGGLIVDARGRRVHAAGRELHLTPTEYRLLRILAGRPGEVVGHGDLLADVWGPGYRDDVHLLRVTMRNLRAKLADASPGRRYIETSYGVGYRLVDPGAGEAPAGEPPAGEAPAGEAPAGEAPAGEAPAGEAPAGEAPAGEDA